MCKILFYATVFLFAVFVIGSIQTIQEQEKALDHIERASEIGL